MTVLTTPPTRDVTGPSPAPERLGWWPASRIVAEREIAVKLRDRTFVLSTIFTLVILAGAFALPALLGGEDGYRIAALGPVAEDVVAELAEQDGSGDAAFALETVPVGDRQEAERLLAAEEADVLLIDTSGSGPGVEIVANTSVPTDVATAVDAVLTERALTDALTGLGASGAEAERALTPVQAPQRLLDPEGDRGVEAVLLEFAFAAVFFFTALTFGLTIAQSVTEEKQQRVVEVLVAAVPVRALLIGKIVGNVVLALGQLVLIIAVGLLVSSVAGQNTLTPLLAGSAGWFVAFFLFGFAMLACLWAAAGAQAPRFEDLGATTLPIQLLVMVPFVVAVSVRDGTLREVLSYVPVTSPIVMPQRLVAGEAAWWEAVISLALIAFTAVALVLLADRLYRGSLLRTGGRVTFAQAWRGATD
jgi:ABC-2 type transport system permease protein